MEDLSAVMNLYLALAVLDERKILRQTLLHAVVVDHLKNIVVIYNLFFLTF